MPAPTQTLAMMQAPPMTDGVDVMCVTPNLSQSSEKKGSSRDLGEVEVDRQGAGKLAVSKHTTTITLLSPC
ncbi:hypothetical protein, partial [Aeromonas caviae]|uniref:hypothetical protein n=1 Tax=Aeromonas caviae TaxID=648 RepID=UPI001FBC12A6